ncbi:MAG TPA: hypothetical protein VK886_04025 [Vicinamibacterales bacterium]|nr:hypothetical protein [Vicinamibacterales bacterium]
MACLNSDGTPTVVAAQLLVALATAEDPTDLAIATGLPMYRVRSGLREMERAGLVEAIGDGYMLTSRGRELLAARV